MAAPILQVRRGNAGVGGTVPALRPGEPAFSTNNFDLFVGFDTSVAGNKFFGSHRYWTRETDTTGSGIRFVERTDGGSNYIELKAPDTALASDVTYALPGSQGASSSVLTNDGSGNLSWSSGSANPEFTGVATFSGLIDANAGLDVVGGSTFDTINVTGIATVGGLLDANAGLDVTGQTTLNNNLSVTGISTFTGIINANGGLDVTGQTELDNINVSVAATFASATVSDLTSGRIVLAGVGGELQDSANLTFNGTSLTIGTGVGITQFSSSVSTGTSTSSVPTSSAVIDFVNAEIGAVDLTLGINADAGGASTVATSQTLTISGTANEVNTAVSGQTITVGLPDSVTVTTALTAPTVNATNVRANDGTTAITITDVTGAVATASNLTVGGDLFVNGNTTQINTTALTVEDRTIDLGIVNGAAPAGATTWDLGILFNYFTDAAKKSAVVWEHGDARFKFASVLGADTNGTDVNTPQLTVTSFAPIEVGQLWVTDCAGTSQVISCTGTERNLENITIDAGSF